MHLGFQLRKGQRLPGFGLELLAGIGPEITVVNIEQQLQSRRFDPLRQRQRGRQIVAATAVGVTAAVGGIDPQP